MAGTGGKNGSSWQWQCRPVLQFHQPSAQQKSSVYESQMYVFLHCVTLISSSILSHLWYEKLSYLPLGLRIACFGTRNLEM